MAPSPFQRGRRGSRLLASALALLLQSGAAGASVAAFASGCGLWGNAPEAPSGCVNGMQCCNRLNGTDLGELMQQYGTRAAIPEILIRQLATGYPVLQDLGVRSLGFDPINVESVQGQPIVISMQLSVTKVSSIDQKEQTFDMQYQLAWTWRDCRVISSCRLVKLDDKNEDFDKFWRPNILMEEQVDERSEVAARRMFISGDGAITLMEDRQSSFRCTFDFTEMPFDKQTCRLTFRMPGTWSTTHRLWFLRVTHPKELRNVQWEIAKPDEWRSRTLSRSFSSPYEHNESVLEIEFDLTRRPRFLLLTYVMPTVIFYAISWVGLWIDNAAVPARAAVGVIPVLIMTNTMIAVARAIPPISYATRLQNVMMFTLCFITIHMLEFGITHFAVRVRKKLAAAHKDEVQVLEESPETMPSQMGVVAKMTPKALVFFCDHFEYHLRWVSPVVFTLCLILTLAV